MPIFVGLLAPYARTSERCLPGVGGVLGCRSSVGMCEYTYMYVDMLNGFISDNSLNGGSSATSSGQETACWIAAVASPAIGLWQGSLVEVSRRFTDNP